MIFSMCIASGCNIEWSNYDKKWPKVMGEGGRPKVTNSGKQETSTVKQGSAILSESVRNRDTGEPGISISIDFGKFPVLVSVSELIITKIWYSTQWFWAFHQNLCYKTCLTLVSVSESESKFSLFLVSVSVSESTRCRTSLSIGIGIEKAGIAGSC